MTPLEYQSLAKRTVTPEAMDNMEFGLTNWALGIAGETAECLVFDLPLINRVMEAMTAPLFQMLKLQELLSSYKPDPRRKEELTDELGDVMWYVAIMCEQIGTDLNDIRRRDKYINIDTVGTTKSSLAALATCGGAVADYVKKVVCHGHELDVETLISKINPVYYHVRGVCEQENIHLVHVFQTNIRKLKLRYPDGFSTEDSINRTA